MYPLCLCVSVFKYNIIELSHIYIYNKVAK